MSSTQEKLVMELVDEICDWDEYCGDENCNKCGGAIKHWKKKLTHLIDSAKREAYKEGYILGGIDVLTKQETARTIQMAKDIEQDNGKRD